MTSEFERKYTGAILELARTRMAKMEYLPPFHAVLRMAGLRVKPPHYRSFFRNVFLAGIVGFATMLAFFGLASLLHEVQVSDVVVYSLPVGLFVGLAMGIHYKNSSRKYSLSKWSEL